MQIFVPYAQPKKTAKCLNSRRLNKQILECLQILSVNTGVDIGWKIPKYVKNHPTTLLWKNNSDYLLIYLLSMFRRTKRNKNHKGYNLSFLILQKYYNFPKLDFFILRQFFKDFTEKKSKIDHLTPEFCKDMQDRLLKKDYNHYSKFFIKGY